MKIKHLITSINPFIVAFVIANQVLFLEFDQPLDNDEIISYYKHLPAPQEPIQRGNMKIEKYGDELMLLDGDFIECHLPVKTI